ncbi:MAG: hypothetical protein AAGH74_04420 [Pseudomonadota bacterium]
MGFLVVCLTAISVSKASATDLPGANDPRFQNAVEDWLNGDGKPALTALNAIAIEGNQAARLLLSSRRFERWSREDIGQADFRKRRKLFTDPNGSSWRTDRDAYHYPLDALQSLNRQQPAETWLKAAKTALAAGERERVLSTFSFQLREAPYLAEFMSEVVTISDYEQREIWVIKQLAMEFRNYAERLGQPPSPKWDLNWEDIPWRAEDEAAFQTAFADARLAAIMHQEYFNMRATDTPEFADKVNLTFQRSAQLLDRYWLDFFIDEDIEFTPAQTRIAGELLLNEAKHASRLWPVRDFCQQHCPNTLPTCLYSGFIAVDDFRLGTHFDTPIEALIPQRRWHASKRARHLVMRTASFVLADDHDQDHLKFLKHVPLDQCLTSSLDRIYPPDQ